MIDDSVTEFLVESAENLDRLELGLVELEQDPKNAPRLASIFRTIHTIKGTCGFLAFSRLEAVSHAGESLLVKLRDGTVELDRDVVTVLLRMVDALRRILAHIDETGAEPVGDDSRIIAELSRLSGDAAARPDPSAATDATRRHGFADERRSGDDRRTGGVADTSLRIDLRVLDDLVEQVGALVLARNQIVQCAPASGTDRRLIEGTRRLDLVSTALQECVTKMRMQPIGTVWGRFPRFVRDLAARVGKRIELQMEGNGTHLDRAVLEAIKDPLTHLVRNCVDHGIEPPETRILAGKPSHGRILLRAVHAGGRINIEIADDGAGIDPARVRMAAVQHGLLSTETAARFSDSDVIDLVFQPGVSTAKQVTPLSGRGVGMDVVRTNVERIGGQIDVRSTIGVGTTFRITIPLTPAAVPGAYTAWGRPDAHAIEREPDCEPVR